MSDYFPTEFAQQIGRKNGLYPKKDIEGYFLDTEHKNKKKRIKARKQCKLHSMMESFQNLSMISDFENSISAYIGHYLSAEQTEILKKIHEITPGWARGKAVDKILMTMDETRSGKDVKELSAAMMMVMGIGNTDSNVNSTSKVTKQYVINMPAKK